MLDTFNYEQTLLETTTSLLNHDLHWSLAHLRASVTRGLVPRQDTCNICLLQYRRRHDPPEEIVIFSCGHLYHCQCLQAKDCGSGSGSARPQQWSCFKCSSNQGGRGGAMADQRRARSTSLAQTNVTSSLREPGLEAHGKKLFVEATLDPQQAQSWDHLRCLYHGPSRLAILSELTHCHGNEKAGLLHPAPQGTGSVFHSEDFKLKQCSAPCCMEPSGNDPTKTLDRKQSKIGECDVT
ncbi:vacuolar protein sorting-associated protein 8 homolog [Gadus chalcogrammus]|uniref:vacuolar protein sorting-associated protein 8 homolog n=1 Tax=Gadus chalcogrammus TaxID=1042646 RepID=UPI0024C49696|nr:vacuolar protein sorting-associated protein 8 homolog [Gadus chalcogrammus]